ncbi:MAG: hypothetical protein AB1689_13130 [Thermodesulfobacteriota bacterium]
MSTGASSSLVRSVRLVRRSAITHSSVVKPGLPGGSVGELERQMEGAEEAEHHIQRNRGGEEVRAAHVRVALQEERHPLELRYRGRRVAAEPESGDRRDWEDRKRMAKRFSHRRQPGSSVLEVTFGGASSGIDATAASSAPLVSLKRVCGCVARPCGWSRLAALVSDQMARGAPWRSGRPRAGCGSPHRADFTSRCRIAR